MVLTLLFARSCHLQIAGCHYASAHRQNGESMFVDRLIRRFMLRWNFSSHSAAAMSTDDLPFGINLWPMLV
jgi:hypothetical protein